MVDGLKIDFEKYLQELIAKIKAYNLNLDQADENRLVEAFWYAEEKHRGQFRGTGEPYFIHPVYIANLAADYHMDINTIIASLLHDVVEDTDVSNQDIKKKFGDDVAFIVKGVTNITNIDFKSKEQKQLRNYVKLLFAMSLDIRVLVIKLFDRLHSLRTLEGLKPETRQRKAFQALEVYLPLAERIGMEDIKLEYGTLAIKSLYEKEYNEIYAHLQDLRKDGAGWVDDVVSELRQLAYRNNVVCDITGREKSIYSIWKKMVKKGVSFDRIYDITAFRFIVNSVEDCYKVLGLLHSEYKSLPGRFKDYISFPKTNNYQSLHTVVFGPDNRMIEVQIRTKEMDEVASYGIAAHWLYKQKDVSDKDRKELQWVRDVVKGLKASSRDEALESAKISMFSDSVFAFTPNGDIITMPDGATVLDFAYAIHSDLGNSCLAAKVNKITKTIRYAIKTGDTIEIIRSSHQAPVQEWLRFVKTVKAKNNIKRYIAESMREDTIILGKNRFLEIVEQYSQKYDEKAVKKYAQSNNYPSVDDVFFSIGSDRIKANSVFFIIFPDVKEKSQAKNFVSRNNNLEENIELIVSSDDNKKKSKAFSSAGVDIPMNFAKCCFPLPGEEISGVVKTGRPILVHKADCKLLEIEDSRNIIPLSWEEDIGKKKNYSVRIFVVAEYKRAFVDLSTAIAKAESNIVNIRIINRSDNFVELYIDLEVVDVHHLSRLIASLSKLQSVKIVERYLS